MALTAQMVKDFAKKAGAVKCGIASMDRFEGAPEGFHPLDVYPDCKSLISMCMRFPHGFLDAENLICYTQGAYKMYEKVDHLAMNVLAFCEENGALGVVVPSDVPYLYWDEKKKRGMGIISHKHAAVRAGLGIMGKNTLLITPEYGNMVYLTSVLIDTELEPDSMITDFGCIPGCQKCIKSCPVGAIHDGTVEQLRCRPNSNIQNERGFDLYTCHECRAACPLRFGRLDKDKKN